MGNSAPMGSPDPMNPNMMTKSMSPAPNAVPNRLTQNHRRYISVLYAIIAL